MKRYPLVLVALSLLIAISCGKSEPVAKKSEPAAQKPVTSAPTGETIKIGAVFSITGPASFLGEPERNTVKMIEDQVNKMGGIQGRKLEVLVEDDEGDETKAVLAVNKLIKNENVLAIIGPSRSGPSMAVVPIAEENQVPLLSCAAAEQIVVPLRKWIFKTPQKDSDCVVRIYEHMKSKTIGKIAIITSTEGFGKAGREQMLKLAPTMGITIVADETYGPQDTDMTAQLTKIRGTDAQAVINWSIVPGQSIIPKNMKQLGMTIPLYQSHGFGNIKYVVAAGDAAEGLIFPAGALLAADDLPDNHPRKALLKQYRDDYESRFKAPASTFGGHAYDALWLLVDALKNVGPDRAKVRDYIENKKGFAGTAGIFNFSPQDHTGLTKDAFELITVKNGKFALLK